MGTYKVAIGSDDAGIEYKSVLLKLLEDDNRVTEIFDV